MNKIKRAFIMPHPPIIIPEIGRGSELEAIKTIEGCKKAAQALAGEKPETIIVITPHGPVFRDAVCLGADPVLKGDFGQFGNKKLKFEFKNDEELLNSICDEIKQEGIFTVKNDISSQKAYGIEPSVDHGVLVPLYFVLKEFKEFKIVHITYGMLGAEELYRCGTAINRAVAETGRHACVIASADLSHRLEAYSSAGFNPDGKKYDEFVVNSISRGDFIGFLNADYNIRENAGECGHRSVTIMLGVFEGRNCETDVYSYEGPFGVGYMVAEIKQSGPGVSVLGEYMKFQESKKRETRINESPYVKLARETIELYIKKGERVVWTKAGGERKATFVSIKKHGILRGCIGTIEPTADCVENEIIDNAIKASTEDPRFPPITEDELNDLSVSVDLLYPPERIDSKSMLDVKEYGVIVSKGFRRGLLLPNLDGIDSIDEQISIALKKGGISPDEKYTLERFKVVRYK